MYCGAVMRVASLAVKRRERGEVPSRERVLCPLGRVARVTEGAGECVGERVMSG